MKIISGGQNGVDQAALAAAKACGLETGGWLPKGCRTLDGPRPNLVWTYNMQEHTSENYGARTEANVRDSDGTLRIAEKFSSPGEKCTLQAIKWHKKPHFDINLKKELNIDAAVSWIKENNIQVLNVAGNSEDTSPGIESTAETILIKIFSQLK